MRTYPQTPVAGSGGRLRDNAGAYVATMLEFHSLCVCVCVDLTAT